MVSYLKSMYGDAATRDNDFGYAWHPKIIGDHSHMPMFVAMNEGRVKGMFCIGQNPATSLNAKLERSGLRKLEWLVVKDNWLHETAMFWKTAPEVRAGEVATADIATEVFFFPSSQVAEYDGSFTNTQRLLQWHYKAADPPGDCRSDMYFTYELGKRLKALYADSTLPRDQGFKQPGLGLRVRRPARAAAGRTSSPRRSSRRSTATTATTPAATWPAPKTWPTTARRAAPRGSTAACSRRRTRTARPTARPTRPACAARSWAGASRGRPTAASSTTASRPTRRAGRGASARSTSGGTRRRASGSAWTCPTSRHQAAHLQGPAGRHRHGRADGTDAFILKADGVGWLYVPEGLVDGPLPTHYEPAESVVRNPLYKQQSSPVLKYWKVDGNPLAELATRSTRTSSPPTG
jgi:formate dehydrogenase major subunit